MKRILWFRRDLRVDDNPLLSLEGEVFPIFIFDTNILDNLEVDDKRVSMIYTFVLELKTKLQDLGLELKIFYGKPEDIFSSFNLAYFDEVVASGDYDDYSKERDRKISHLIHFRYVNDTYLLQPKEVLKSDKTPYLVFTPFYKKALPILQSKEIPFYHKASQVLYIDAYENMITLEYMGFVEQNCEYRFDRKIDIEDFKKKLKNYKIDRDYLDVDAGSNLSVALRFGLVSIREVYRSFKGLVESEAFIRQLIFRDYYAYLLFHFPSLEIQNYKGSFNGVQNQELFEKFCTAQTGVPIIDAGVRELISTGRMHNRVRMVVASFFTKDLLLPWQWGEKFFATYLLDYDVASNILSWQWSAGTGIDPQPYFRIFNPYLQSKKFDKDASYMKRYLRELEYIEAKYFHDEGYLLLNKLEKYPQPIVHHKEVAKVAINAFKNI